MNILLYLLIFIVAIIVILLVAFIYGYFQAKKFSGKRHSLNNDTSKSNVVFTLNSKKRKD
tara:strand:+ start:1115 stop:1294 length:180 start_codon:yes stop_codon:yes gene_type:complete